MFLRTFAAIISAGIIIISATFNRLRDQPETLILVHAVFRHGDRTPDSAGRYPNDPYKNEEYLPFGPGELTDQGKARAYKLGRILRNRYNEFFDNVYLPKILEARSTDFNRTQMSLEIVLTALFASQNEDESQPFLKKQPIPYYYESLESDKILFGPYACPNYTTYLQDELQSMEVQKIISNYTPVFDYLSQNTGWGSVDFSLASMLYFTLTTEKEWGFLLPKWTNDVYPDTLKEIASTNYLITTGSKELKQITSGSLLRKIVHDTLAKITGKEAIKMFLYSGHEFNVAGLLNTLNVFEPHVPPYGACVLIEVHYIDNQYGVKVFYENYQSIQSGLLKMPGCEEFCPLNKFISLVKKYFPEEESYLAMSDHNKLILIFIAILLIIQYVTSTPRPRTSSDSNSTLQLVHILFRHGDRTTDRGTLYPKDPHFNVTYYPYGPGELNNKGKQRAYKLGKLLRQRYDKFLGKIYTPDILEAWSSDVNRTKVSLQLVLAGLFPPTKEQIWESGLNWQPIPFSALPRNKDKLFLGVFCPEFQKHFSEVIRSPKLTKEHEQHSKIFEYISEHTGLTVKTYWDLFYVYMCLTTEKEYGLILPEWTQKVYPQPLRDFTIKSYGLLTATTELRRLNSGSLLKKIVDDSKAKVNNQSPLKSRKIFLYSGHELNIAYLLHTLEVFEPHIPPYGSYVSFELHKINDVYGFKIYYEDYSSPTPKLLKLPACEEFCPLDKFIALLEEYFPEKGLCKSADT